jgi:MFS family permease
MYGSIFFIGRLAGNLILAKYGDSIGRIKLLRVSLVLSMMCYGSIVYVIRNNILVYVPIFIYGLVSCWRCNLSYIYGLEIISSSF